ncbi:MAG: hypothetical protein V4576_01010 [Patescibacteria group bacterium]
MKKRFKPTTLTAAVFLWLCGTFGFAANVQIKAPPPTKLVEPLAMAETYPYIHAVQLHMLSPSGGVFRLFCFAPDKDCVLHIRTTKTVDPIFFGRPVPYFPVPDGLYPWEQPTERKTIPQTFQFEEDVRDWARFFAPYFPKDGTEWQFQQMEFRCPPEFKNKMFVIELLLPNIIELKGATFHMTLQGDENNPDTRHWSVPFMFNAVEKMGNNQIPVSIWDADKIHNQKFNDAETKAHFPQLAELFRGLRFTKIEPPKKVEPVKDEVPKYEPQAWSFDRRLAQLKNQLGTNVVLILMGISGLALLWRFLMHTRLRKYFIRKKKIRDVSHLNDKPGINGQFGRNSMVIARAGGKTSIPPPKNKPQPKPKTKGKRKKNKRK